MYTGQIAFVALGSQNVTLSGEEVQDGCSQGEREPRHDEEGLSVPPPGPVVVEPCSPKSAYCLANKVCLSPLRSDTVADSSFAYVGLTGLCDIALKDVQSKLDANNIVQELFSPFAAKSAILQLWTAHCTDVSPTQPQACQRNGTRAPPVEAETFSR